MSDAPDPDEATDVRNRRRLSPRIAFALAGVGLAVALALGILAAALSGHASPRSGLGTASPGVTQSPAPGTQIVYVNASGGSGALVAALGSAAGGVGGIAGAVVGVITLHRARSAEKAAAASRVPAEPPAQ